MSRNFNLWPAALVGAAALLLSCESGPKAPEKGTPEFFWQAAKESFAAGDYVKTSDNLQSLMKSGSPLVAQARPWRLVVAAGLMKANADLADQLESGARNHKADPAPFRRGMSATRSMASQWALQFGEAYVDFEKAQAAGDVTLAFAFPSVGNMAMPPSVIRVAEGLASPDADAESMRNSMAQRGVLQAVCSAAGANGDSAKAAQMLKAPPVTVPRGVFETAMAQSLYDAAMLFSNTKLDMPDRQELLLTQANNALKQAPGGKDTDTLKTQIAKALKKPKA